MLSGAHSVLASGVLFADHGWTRRQQGTLSRDSLFRGCRLLPDGLASRVRGCRFDHGHVAAATLFLGRPRVFARRASDLVLLENANPTEASTIVDACRATTAITRFAAATARFAFLPRENHTGNANHFGFHFEAGFALGIWFGIQGAAMVTDWAALHTRLITFLKATCSGRDAQGEAEHKRER